MMRICELPRGTEHIAEFVTLAAQSVAVCGVMPVVLPAQQPWPHIIEPDPGLELLLHGQVLGLGVPRIGEGRAVLSHIHSRIMGCGQADIDECNVRMLADHTAHPVAGGHRSCAKRCHETGMIGRVHAVLQ